MTDRPDIDVVRVGEWLEFTDVHGEQASRLMLLDMDVQSAQLSLRDYLAAKVAPRQPGVVGVDYLVHARLFHSAKSFVCSVRRVGRVVESLPSKRVFPDELSKAFRQLWRRKKANFERFVPARDAIEHIDERAGKKSGHDWVHLNLHSDDTLAVTPSERAPVTLAALADVVATRDEIVSLVVEHLPREDRFTHVGARKKR